MAEHTLIAWNVNGIRAAMKKGFLQWVQNESPDVLALQEVKAEFEQVQDDLAILNDYKIFWSAANKKGYSGVASFSKENPVDIKYGFGIERFDSEGRIIVQEFLEYTILNIYFPNGQRDQGRLDYKMAFYDATLDFCQNLRRQGKKLIICGDYNTAHKEIDLRNPKANETNSGFLPIERAWLDKFIHHGYVDIFRKLHPEEPDHYTWWTYRMNARERNVGWRIDCFFITEDLTDYVQDAFIMPDVPGSDHCPVVLKMRF